MKEIIHIPDTQNMISFQTIFLSFYYFFFFLTLQVVLNQVCLGSLGLWNMQELPEHQRSDAVSSMVYEANARVRDPVYGCVGAISSLQQQVDVLQTQLAIAQAEVVHMRMRQYPSSSNGPNNSPDNNDSPSAKLMSSQTKSFYIDQANLGESLWSC